MKHHEFWSAPVFNARFYVYLFDKMILAGIGPRDILKADYGIPNGDLRA
jgi:hypothetical protein